MHILSLHNEGIHNGRAAFIYASLVYAEEFPLDWIQWGLSGIPNPEAYLMKDTHAFSCAHMYMQRHERPRYLSANNFSKASSGC